MIAPDQRGYGATDRPEAVEDYDVEHLTGDLVGLLDHLKIYKAVLVGHDWGGLSFSKCRCAKLVKPEWRCASLRPQHQGS
jgi:pimeloyl-ACP methyl ester carboxylesterase